MELGCSTTVVHTAVGNFTKEEEKRDSRIKSSRDDSTINFRSLGWMVEILSQVQYSNDVKLSLYLL